MAQNLDEKTAIEQSITDLRESKRRLEEQRDAIVEQVATKEKLLRYWEERLAEMTGAHANGAGKRLRKGEPLRRIVELFQSKKSNTGLSIVEIAEATGIGWSTARGTLMRHKEQFEERENLWYLKI